MKNNTLLHYALPRVSIAWIVLLIAMTATIWGGLIVKQVEQQQIKRNIFDYRVERIRDAITNRIIAYQQVLHSGVGLFAACHSINRQAWHSFVEKLQIAERYTGIQGVGFSQLILPEEKDSHIRAIQAEGGFFEHYTLRPAGIREQYTSIIYLEPLDLRNRQAIGYDMFSEPTRRIAMERARDTGKAALSGKVTLVQEIDEDVQAGFLIYVPVYRAGLPHSTVEERRAALIGYVYSPFRMNDFMQGVFGKQPAGIDLHIYDGYQTNDFNPKKLVYDALPEISDEYNTHHARFSDIRTIEIAGHRWTLQFTSVSQFEAVTQTYGANIVFWGGTVVSILLFGFTRSFITVNLLQAEHEVNSKLQAEIRERQRVEIALRQSEERFDLAVQGSNDGLWDWNLETHEIYFSPRWKEMLGYTVKEIPNHLEQWSERVHPDDLAQVTLDAKKYLNREMPIYQNTHRVQHKDGHYVWILTRGIAIWDAEGKPIRMVGTHTDLTQLKQVEAELRDSEERFNLAMQGSNDGLWDWNIETGEVYFSPRWKEMLGYTVDEIQNELSEWSERVHPDDLAQVTVDVKKYFNREIPIYQNTHRVQHKDGHYVWILDRGIAIWDAEGKPVRMVGTHTDLTQLKQVENELNVLNRDLIAMLENTSDFIYFKDQDSRFHFCSQTVATITGHRSWRDLIGKHDSEVFPPEMAKIYADEEVAVFLEGKPLINRVDPYYDAQGRPGWVHTNKWPVFSDNGTQVIGIFGISRDITERKRIEVELRDAKQLSDDIINGLPSIFYMLDKKGNFIRWNTHFNIVTGYSDQEILRKSVLEVIAEADRFLVAAKISDVFETGTAFVEAELLDKQGKRIPYFFTGRRTILQEQTYLIGVGQDITERKQMEKKLWKLANTDFLTGLMNRRYFMNKMEEEFARVHNHEVAHSAILMLDLDHFKRINDNYNHAVGDSVLKHLATLIQKNLRQIDIAGRLGGEEFAIILPYTDMEHAKKCAERLCQLIAMTPIRQDNQDIFITTSIGVSTLQEDDPCADTALGRADNALYCAKKAGRNCIHVSV